MLWILQPKSIALMWDFYLFIYLLGRVETLTTMARAFSDSQLLEPHQPKTNTSLYVSWGTGVCRLGPVGDPVSPPLRRIPLCWRADCTWSSGPWAWLCSPVRAPERHTHGRLIISNPILRQLLSGWSVIIWVLLSRCALFVVQILPLCDYMAASAV